ncbi:MAG: CBS domain-containing protein [Methylovirgula sp.]
MTIAQILANKGREVATTPPHRTMKEAADILSSRNIGAIVIADVQGSVLGILSERDIVRAIATRGPTALDDAVSMHMTTRVATAVEEDTVLATVERMTEGRFRHVPVVKNGKLVGIISIGDVVKFRLEQMEHEQSALREYIASV